MSKSLLGGSAVAALFSASLIFYAAPSIADTLAQATSQKPSTQQAANGAQATQAAETSAQAGADIQKTAGQTATASPAKPPQPFLATAYALKGRTASGRSTNRGIIAADRRLLPLGTRVRLEAGNYSGEYLVADTGGAVRGRKIDIWVPNSHEAMRFGRRTVKLTVLTHERGNRAPRRARR